MRHTLQLALVLALANCSAGVILAQPARSAQDAGELQQGKTQPAQLTAKEIVQRHKEQAARVESFNVTYKTVTVPLLDTYRDESTLKPGQDPRMARTKFRKFPPGVEPEIRVELFRMMDVAPKNMRRKEYLNEDGEISTIVAFDGQVRRTISLPPEPRFITTGSLEDHWSAAPYINDEYTAYWLHPIAARDYAHLLELRQAGTRTLDVTEDGLLGIEFAPTERSGMQRQMYRIWFDPQHSYMPQRMEVWWQLADEFELNTRTEIEEFRQLENGVFVPTKATTRHFIIRDELAGEPYFDLHMQVAVDESSWNEAVDENLFAIEIPADARVLDQRKSFGKVPKSDVVPLPGRSEATLAIAADQRITSVIRDARLCRLGAVFFLAGPDTPRAGRLANWLWDYDRFEDILAFFPRAHAEDEFDEIDFEARGWQRPAAGEVALIVYDDAGEFSAQRTFRIGDDNVYAECTAFLQDRLPAERDGRAQLAAAQEEAEKTGRNVWIIGGGSRCGPCILLARWMDEHHELLERDFVILKITHPLDSATDEIWQEYAPAARGIPWMAMIRPDGSKIIDSFGANGNIGFPSSETGIAHLRAMLEAGRTKLTDEDIQALVESRSQ